MCIRDRNYNMIDEQINNEPPDKENITVLAVEPLQEPYIKEIPNALEAMQKEVGGPIQAVYPFAEEAAIICNDEAKLEGMRLNRALYDLSLIHIFILLVAWIISTVSSCAVMGVSGVNSIMSSSYFAEDEDIYMAEGYYLSLIHI